MVREAVRTHESLRIEQLALDHYDLVFRFCARRLGPDRAADAAQDTFITAMKVLHRFRGESHITTWLLGIAHNECRRLSRKHRVETPLLEWHPSDDPNEHDLVQRQMLRQAMTSLSPAHREVVLLHEVEGLTHDEAALILGVPVGTVKSRLHHALIALRKQLMPEAK
ncbi:MAG: RNA polymerase sigma factor [Fimbriimonas sp.]